MATSRASLLLAAAFFIASCRCSAQSAQRIETSLPGEWVNDDGSRVIEFRTKGSEVVAIIKKAKNAALIGQQQISGLHCSGSTCNDGTFYLISRGLAFPCSITLKSATAIEITVTSGSRARSQTWTRHRP